MNPERFVVLGLAHARSAWFRSVAQWANSASLPIDFVKCLSGEEVLARLASGRPFSALLVDAALPAIDRDLVATADRAACAVLVIEDPRVARDWRALGASAVLPPTFGREELLAALADHALRVSRAEGASAEPGEAAAPAVPGGLSAAFLGAGGTGTSTAAIALAQGVAGGPAEVGGPGGFGGTVLVDCRLNAEQAMLHDARDVVPGVQELVDAHRRGTPSLDEVRSLTFRVEERGYDLLLGLRRARFWSTLRPQAVDAALGSLARAYRVVVCDVEADLEGEDAGGSVDVEERNGLSRAAVARADVVFALGAPSMKGLHSLCRVVHDLYAFGTPPSSVVPVLNRAPRASRARASLAGAFTELARSALGGAGAALPAPVFVPERRIDEALRDGVALPPSIVQPLTAAFADITAATGAGGRPGASGTEPVPVRPGSLGSWSEQAVG